MGGGRTCWPVPRPVLLQMRPTPAGYKAGQEYRMDGQDHAMLNPMDLYVAVFGNTCLCDKYDELVGLAEFEAWADSEICKKIADNKYKHYVN